MSAVRQETEQHTLPPQAVMTQFIMGFVISQSIAIAARLNIADLLHESPKTADELAETTNTHSLSLFRLLRALASVGIFQRDEQNRFHLTPLGETLRSDVPNSVNAFAIMMGEANHWRVYEEMMHSIRTSETAFEKVHGLEPWAFFQQKPDVAKIFDNAMTSFTSGIAPAVITSYDFSNAGTIADIAGGHGILLAQILKANLNTKGILFDQEYVAEGARSTFEKEGVADRCEIVGGNFFESVPSGADIYMMKHIVHDWDDERAITILKNCHKAMNDDSKLLLVEIVLLEKDESGLGPILDLEMLLIPGGRERTANEYAKLFDKAGFKLTQIIPTPSPMFLIEGVKA
jgi:hypothetical protein